MVTKKIKQMSIVRFNIYSSKNKTPIMLNKANKIPISISF